MKKFGTQRKIDLSYLRQNFYNKPKQIHLDISKSLKKYFSKSNKNNITLVDHGCADGQFLNVLSNDNFYKNFQLIGTDVHSKLLKKAKKQIGKRLKTKIGTIGNSKLFKKKSIDVSSVCGVLPLFKDLKILKNCIDWSKPKGVVFVSSIFNDNDYDVFVNYNDSTSNLKKAKKLSGWNIFSKKTVSKFLKKIKRIKKFRFVKFQLKVNIKPNKKMPYKLWTLKTKNGKNICVNGLSLILNQEFLIINIR